MKASRPEPQAARRAGLQREPVPDTPAAAAEPQASAQDPLAARMPGAAEREQAIRELAYSFFLARGREEGHPLDDWLRAEAQVLEQERQASAPALAR
jgi:hypothetical protein